MRTLPIGLLIALAACNPLPEGNGLTLSPEAPLTDDDLTAYIEGDLGDADKVTWTYTWSMNGTVVDDLTGDTVPAARTSKGETWEVSVQAVAGKKETVPLTASVSIGNTPPVGESVSISPTEPTTLSSLTATATGSDADGDTLGWVYRWEVNGTGVSGVTEDTLTPDRIQKGDQVKVIATPADGSADGEPVESSVVTVLNTAPTPPSIAISPVAPTDADALVCEIVADGLDVDEDALTYTITWTVDGAAYGGAVTTTEVDGDTVPAGSTTVGEVWSCTAVASDGTDEAAPVNSESVTIEALVVKPGVVDVAIALDGYAVRCHAWDGDTCVHVQQMVECGTCGDFTGCGTWHDTSIYNNSDDRTVLNFCMLATGSPEFVSWDAGGPLTGPASCGWSAEDHPICESDRASIVVPGASDNERLGLLIDPEYCDDDPRLLTVECSGW